MDRPPVAPEPAGFGSETYAREELCAELSSALIGAELGLPVTHLDNHASCIASWIKLLRHDERALLSAAAKAEAAAGWLLERAGRAVTDGDGETDDETADPLPLAA